MGFVNVNGRILDFSEYKKDVSALRFELMYELVSCAAKYGFKVADKKIRSYDVLSMALHCKELGLVLSVKMAKMKNNK